MFTSITLKMGDSSKELQALSCHGLRSEYSTIDRDLWAWYCRAKSNGPRRVSKSLLQRHAKLAFSRAGICNFKASDGWYRRWISRWQKHDQFAMSVLNGDSTEPTCNAQVIDRMKILHDVASQQLSAEISKTEDPGNVRSADDTHSEQDTGLQSHFVEATQGSVVDAPMAKVNSHPTLLPDSTSAAKKLGYANPFMNDLFKQSYSGKNNFAPSGKSFLDVTSGSTSKVSCLSDLQLECNRKRTPQTAPEPCREDESLRNLSEHSLDIMDYLALHITESCENSQFGNGSNCMSHSNTIDHILGSSTSDSMGSFLCCSMLSSQHHQSASDVPLCSEHLSIDHLREFAGLVSQLGGPYQDDHEASKSAPPVVDQLMQCVGADLTKNISDPEYPQVLEGDTSLPKTVTDVDPISHTEALTVDPAFKAPNKQLADSAAPSTAQGERRRKKKKKRKKLSSKLHKKGERYLPKFKDKVLAYASNHTFKETAKKFKVNNATISSWKKDKAMVNSEVPVGQKLVDGDGASPLESRPAEEQFLAWLRRCREEKQEVTREEVCSRVEQLLAQCGSEQDAHKNSRWFLMWAERLKKQQCEDELELWVISDREKEQHIQYPLAFKMEVAEFADRHSQVRASKTFNISRKRVFEWLKVFRKKLNVVGDDAWPEVNPRSSSGRAAADVEVDRQIWEWYKTQMKKPSGHEVRQKGVELYRARGHEHIKCSYGWYRRWSERFQAKSLHEGDALLLEWVLARLEQGHAVSHSDLQAQALQLLTGSKSAPFKASPGWAIRFCKRYPELLYHSPTVESKLPPALTTKVDEFRSRVHRAIQEKSVRLSAVGSMDELHVNLSALLPVNVESGVRRQLLRRPELGNCHVTVVLACLADGTLLPPVVIAKGNVNAATEGQDVPVVQQKNAHMDEKCMKFWLEHIWFKNVTPPSVLVMDCYEVHSLPAVKDMCASHGTSCLIIPGGCASKLQPLDVAVKRSFQDVIEKEWAALSTQSSKTWENGSKLQLPGHQKIVEWVSIAYKQLLDTMKDTISRSFLVTGFTVADNLECDALDNFSTDSVHDQSNVVMSA